MLLRAVLAELVDHVLDALLPGAADPLPVLEDALAVPALRQGVESVHVLVDHLGEALAVGALGILVEARRLERRRPVDRRADRLEADDVGRLVCRGRHLFVLVLAALLREVERFGQDGGDDPTPVRRRDHVSLLVARAHVPEFSVAMGMRFA
ncbi:hypothetical protein [Halalkalicoccus sp. NIPERK01]|uniref:hypothetical protein n=1 Tax=Halalkalicoccus sp. NIPERK01 TaxID=3053469 RepID=UPI00256EE36B|nr:hypothetical protein [Halalkalicoccus sp. NIPERK01]MDL5361180.1 hypothetical protein [Halalkalicoccus sp. NIPERK01]